MTVLNFVRRWEGVYFDGLSAARHPVRVDATPEGLKIQRENESVLEWPTSSYRAEAGASGAFVRLVRTPYTGESVLVEECSAARLFAAEDAERAHSQSKLTGAFFLIGGIVLLGWVLWMVQPWMIRRTAALMPVSVEERLGSAVVSTLAPARNRLTNPALDAVLKGATTRLNRAAGPPYRYHVSVTRSGEVNAWAAPGGSIVFYCGLVRSLKSADELAAVLAHEMMHVAERHSTTNLVRTLAMRVGISIIGGGGEALVDSTAMLGALHFMRGDEEAADRDAVDLLVRAGIDPAGLASAFGRIAESHPDLPSALKYLSTHPPLEARKAAAAQAARAARGVYVPVAGSGEWGNVLAACVCE